MALTSRLRIGVFLSTMSLLLLGTLPVVSQEPTQTVSFLARTDYPQVGGPIAFGDFNGDGIPDMATGGETGSLSVLLGNGDGTFHPAPGSPATGVFPVFIAVGDFNEDGFLDVVAVNSSISSTLFVFLGRGDGTLSPPVTYPAGRFPAGIAVADFNGDGHLDLGVSGSGFMVGQLLIFLGHGDGTFELASSQPPPPGFARSGVVAADFNSDGIQDLAVAANDLVVYLGNGDGTFQPPRRFPNGARAGAPAVADFNGDGFPDVAIAGFSAVSVLLGNGDGTFRNALNISVPSPQNSLDSSIALADLNGDGAQDLVTNNGGVSVLLGNGDGTFNAPRTLEAPFGIASVAAGDLNGDGRPDLAAGSRNLGFDFTSVWIGKGDGTFVEVQSFPVGPDPVSVAVGDFNRDGFQDLVTTNFGFAGSEGNTISVLLGNGDGTFQPSQDYIVGFEPSSVAVGDFNGDGIQDLAVAFRGTGTAESTSVAVLLGNGDGTFQTPQNYEAGLQPISVAIGDFNGDGVQDLAVANFNTNYVSILLGRGDGTFEPPRNVTAGQQPLRVVVGDFNGDGMQDLAVANQNSSEISILLGNGDGTFRAGTPLMLARPASSVIVSDFNEDGFPDLAVIYRSFVSSVVSTFLGNGDGTFQSGRDWVFAGRFAADVAAGDFSLDGHQDLALTIPNSGNVAILAGNGDGTFLRGQHFGAPTIGSAALALGDFNGDGLPDLAVTGETPVGPFRDVVSILINNTPRLSRARP